MEAVYTYLGSLLNMTAAQVQAFVQTLNFNSSTTQSILSQLSTSSLASNETFTTACQNCVSNINSITAKIRELNPDAVILVANQYNPYQWLGNDTISSLFDAGVKAFNSLLNSKKTSNYTVVDVYSTFSSSTSTSLTNASIDSSTGTANLDFHPNATGHTKIAEAMAAAYETAASSAHTWDDGEITTEATCTEDGVKTYTCTNCGTTKTETIAATGHTTETQNAKAATCTENGYTGDTVCTACGETISTGELISATGHTTEVQNAKDATCTEDGYTGDTVCTVCGETISTGTVIAATGHTTEVQNAKDATCTEDGYTGDTVCTVCGETISTGTVIPATGHNYSSFWFKWSGDYSTCTAHPICIVCDTYANELWSCTVDKYSTMPTCTEDGEWVYTATLIYNGTEYSDIKTVTLSAAYGHSWNLIFSTVTKEATCTEDGERTYTCPRCYSTTKIEAIPATGHSYEAMVAAPTCTEKGYTTYTCTACGDSYTADETEATGHSYEAVVTEPTCTENGETTYTCTVCGDSYTADETEATGHSYGAPVFTWSEDGKSCQVSVTCADCGDVQSTSATVTSAVKTEATATEKGVTTYTATVTVYGVEYTETKDVEDIPATGSSSGSSSDSSSSSGSSSGKSSSADTGDSSDLALWVGLLLLSGAGVAAAVSVRKKRTK